MESLHDQQVPRAAWAAGLPSLVLRRAADGSSCNTWQADLRESVLNVHVCCWCCVPQVVMISAAKFHSAAVTADGQLLTWGWGRGGRLGEPPGAAEACRIPGWVDALQATCCCWRFSAAKDSPAQLVPTRWPAGHPDAHVHSGEGAVIAPLVVSALGKRQVAVVAAAKHHTVLCTSAGEQAALYGRSLPWLLHPRMLTLIVPPLALLCHLLPPPPLLMSPLCLRSPPPGEVYTMGSNRHGQLGYAIDSQPTPRRVSSLRQRVVAVAAANKHSVAVTAGGDVYTWGSNVLGQVGSARAC